MNSCASIIAATLRVAPGAPMIAPEAAMRSAAHLPALTRSSRHVQGPAAAAHAMNRKEAVVHFCRRQSKALRHHHASDGFNKPRDSLGNSNLIGSAACRSDASSSACRSPATASHMVLREGRRLFLPQPSEGALPPARFGWLQAPQRQLRTHRSALQRCVPLGREQLGMSQSGRRQPHGAPRRTSSISPAAQRRCFAA